MAITIGILQGRLSPSTDGRFQFFPKDWAKEFPIASNLGFDAIEWIFDWVDFENNPILNPNERMSAISQSVKESGVQISSICADYYMKYRLSGADADNSVVMLDRLIDAAEITAEKLILVPLLEGNAPRTEIEKKELIKNVSRIIPQLKSKNVRIGFETEMPVNELIEFIDGFNSDKIGVYYDIGNCTSYGFDCSEDIRLLGRRVFGIHAKDRKLHTTQSLVLGAGDADYPGCFKSFKDIGFSGTIIMQAWRGQDYLSDAKQQLIFLKEILKKL